MKIPELLSPVGSSESLRAAVASGCDAVYLGGRRFNARYSADNFSDDELEDIIDYCHVRGVLVYITVNTLYGNDELKDVADFCEMAYRAGADAFIMQDIGAALFVKKNFPAIKLIASTQTTVGDKLGAELLKMFDRIIIAREATLESIRDIVALGTVETEVFVHGALCVCHSGQCLMSSMLGGRSGNRGRCAQPCRLSYKLIESNSDKPVSGGYLLSMRDLCALNILPHIVETGVDSLKIEGRMKSPEYVALTTRLYRDRLDAIAAGDYKMHPDAIDKLLRVFNRGSSFTEGYFKNHGGADMMSVHTPKNTGVYVGNIESFRPASKKAIFRASIDLVPGDGIEVYVKAGSNIGAYISKEYKAGERAVIEFNEIDVFKTRLNIGDRVHLTYDKRLMDGLRSSREDLGKLTVSAKVYAKKTKPVQLELRYGDICVVAEGAVCEPAAKHPTSAADIATRLGKTGQTTFIFHFENIQADTDIYIGVKDLNELRRSASDLLTKAIISKSKRKDPEVRDNINPPHSGSPACTRPILSIQCAEADQLEAVIEAYISGKNTSTNGDTIIIEAYAMHADGVDSKSGEIPLETTLKAIRSAREAGLKIIIAMPRTISGDIGMYSNMLDRLPPADGYLLRNFGQLCYFTKYYENNNDTELIADFCFNAFNSLTADFLLGAGFRRVTLSPELDLVRLCQIALPTSEIIIHGRLPLMVTNQCPIGNKNEGCRKHCAEYGVSKGYRLRDGLGLDFPIQTDCVNCIAQILNSKPVYTLNKLDEILTCRAGALRLSFTTETASEAAEISMAYRNALDKAVSGERASFDSQKIRGIYDMGVTNGHFFRGVL